MRLTRQQVRAVDRIAIERFHVPGIVLMENAARGATAVALQMLAGQMPAGQMPAHQQRPAVLILCGGGNNGGDGLAIARHLHNSTAQVQIGLTVEPARYRGDAAINWRIVEAMGLPYAPAEPGLIRARPWDLIIDAIFGTGLDQPPRPPFDALAQAVNASGRAVLAIDLPSGLDCDTGQPMGPIIRASQTATFVAMKRGFDQPGAQAFTGPVTVVDIGCPRAAIEAALKA